MFVFLYYCGVLFWFVLSNVDVRLLHLNKPVSQSVSQSVWTSCTTSWHVNSRSCWFVLNLRFCMDLPCNLLWICCNLHFRFVCIQHILLFTRPKWINIWLMKLWQCFLTFMLPAWSHDYNRRDGNSISDETSSNVRGGEIESASVLHSSDAWLNFAYCFDFPIGQGHGSKMHVH